MEVTIEHASFKYNRLFGIIAVSLDAKIMNTFVFHTEFECVCIPVTTLIRSGIMYLFQARRTKKAKAPSIPQVQRCSYAYAADRVMFVCLFGDISSVTCRPSIQKIMQLRTDSSELRLVKYLCSLGRI